MALSKNSGLVLHLPMNEKNGVVANDGSRYGNNGSLGAGTPANMPVWSEHGLRFDGVDDFIRITSNKNFGVVNTMSTLVWVKGEQQNGMNVVCKWDSILDERCFRLITGQLNHKRLQVSLSDDGTSTGHTKEYYTSIDVFDNIWHLIGFVFDGGSLKLYIDGIEDLNAIKVADNAITTIHESSQDSMIGCNLSNNILTNFFGGIIDVVRIYNRALLPAEIQDLYNQEVHRYD